MSLFHLHSWGMFLLNIEFWINCSFSTLKMLCHFFLTSVACFFGCAGSSLWPMGSLIFLLIFRCGVWDLVPWPGRWDLGLLHWEHVVLATGPPGRSLNLHSFLWKICSCLNCCFPVSNTSFFWMLSRFFHFLFVFRSLIMMYHGLRFLSAYPVWSSLIFLNVRTYVFCQIWDVFRLYVLKSFPPQ